MPSTQIVAKVDKSQKTKFERITESIEELEELEDIADANDAYEILQEMIDNNVDINTLATQSDMNRKYGLDKELIVLAVKIGTRGDVYK